MKAIMLDRIAAVLGFLGIFVSGTLAFAEIAGKDVPCGGSNDCAAVAQHPSSHLLGVPNAYLGLALYVILTALAIIRLAGLPSNRKLVQSGFALSLIGAIFSCYLTFIALTEIKHTCIWCLGSNAAIVALFLVHAARLQSADAEAKDPRLAPLVSICAALCLGGLGLVGSNLTKPLSALKAPISDSVYQKFPLIPSSPNQFGNPDAPVTVVEFADLTCPHCRTMLPKIKQIVSQSGGKMRLVMRFFPLPGDQHLMGLPGAVLAEYCATKGRFWEFVEGVYGSETVPDVDSLYKVVSKIGLDTKDADKALHDKDSEARKRNLQDVNACDAYGLIYTPTFFVLLPNQPPIIALQTDIEQILASEPVRKAMAGG